jgi:hypothetical protein
LNFGVGCSTRGTGAIVDTSGYACSVGDTGELQFGDHWSVQKKLTQRIKWYR